MTKKKLFLLVSVIGFATWFLWPASDLLRDQPTDGQARAVEAAQAASSLKNEENGGGPAELAERGVFPLQGADALESGSRDHGAGDPLTEFATWAEAYLAQDRYGRDNLLETGVVLAGERREFMKTLIREDPRAALANAVPWEVREELPAAVAALLEKPVSGVGDMDVYGIAPPKGHEEGDLVIRHFRTDTEQYRAYVYGDRLAQRTSRGVFAHGIAVDDLLAVHESPLRRVSQAEVRAKGIEPMACPVDEETAAIPHRRDEVPQLAETAAGVMAFCCQEHAAAYEGEASEFQILSEPYRSTGLQSILVMRVNFGGDEGSVGLNQAYQTMLTVNRFFEEASYRRMGFRKIHVTEAVLTMPRDVDDYLDEGGEVDEETGEVSPAGFRLLLDDAIEAAFEDGYVSEHDFYMVAFPDIGFPWGGLGMVGGSGSWIQGNFGTGVVAHELGHNFGLFHASYWKPLGPVTAFQYPGDNARYVEYGNVYDVMGGAGNVPRNHFSGNFKNIINWLPTGNIHVVEHGEQPEGPLRLHRLDGGNLLQPARKHSIRVRNPDPQSFPDPPAKDLWIDFRQLFTGSDRAMNGVVVQWGDDGSAQGSHLLNLNPDRWPIDTVDAALRVGETFPFPDQELLITPLEIGGEAPNEHVDVLVTRGTLRARFLNPLPAYSVINPEGTVEWPVDLAVDLLVEAEATGSPMEAVRFYAGDALLGDGVEIEPGLHTFTLSLAEIGEGDFELVAVASNEAGNSMSTRPVPVRVTGPLSGAPQVTLTVEPMMAVAGETVTLTATLTDHEWGEDLTVGFRMNGETLGTSTSEPHAFAWIPETTGEFSLTAFAEVEGARVVSAPVVVLVFVESPDVPLTVTPGNVLLGETVNLEVSDIAEIQDIAGVEFFADGTLIGTAGPPPSTLTWTPDLAGVRRLWAVFLLEDGNRLNSSVFNLEVGGGADPSLVWTTAPPPVPLNLYGLHHRDGELVAVGAGGTVLHTTNGVNWTPSPGVTNATLRGIGGGGGTLVAVGEKGTFLRSTDAREWTPVETGISVPFFSVAYGAGKFVAVGGDGRVRSSPDGFTWTPHSSGTSRDLFAVTHGPDGFVAVGRSGAAVTSPDGVVWTPRSTGISGVLRGVAHGNGRYVAVGGDAEGGAVVAVSETGANWVIQATPPPVALRAIHHAAGIFVAVGAQGAAAASSDGSLWVSGGTGGTFSYLALSHLESGFVAVGQNGAVMRTLAETFAGWLARQSLDGGNDSGAVHADPNGMGMANLVRYALGMDGEIFREWLPRHLLLEEDGQTYLGLRYSRLKERGDLLYKVEVSQNLREWVPVETVGGVVGLETDGDLQTITARDGVPLESAGPRRYLRVRFEMGR